MEKDNYNEKIFALLCLGIIFSICQLVYLELHSANISNNEITLVRLTMNDELDLLVNKADSQNERTLLGILLVIRGSRLAGHDTDLFNHITIWSQARIDEYEKLEKEKLFYD